jgi:hypothetical protein
MPTEQFDEGMGIGLLAVLAVIVAALILMHTWSQRPTIPDHEGFAEGFSADGNPDADQLVNYYVLASYNTPCEGSYDGGTVSTRQIRKVLKNGARFIDFAVYTMPQSCTGDGTSDEPAVAGSNSESDISIGTSNCLPLSHVVREVASTAFSAGRVPRPTEPLLLHFRIHTQHESTLTQLGHLIKRELGSRLLPANKFGGNDVHGPATVSILATPLAELRGKCIIIIESKNREWANNRALADVVNVAHGTGEPFFTKTTAPILRATAAPGSLRERNKQTLALITPTTEHGSGPHTFPIGPALWVGSQLPAVAFQTDDENTRAAIEFFKTRKAGFVLKPLQLQQFIIKLKKPQPQDKALSYTPRTTTKPYFKLTV